MSITSIRQWQWIILSLLIGAGVGSLRQQAAGDLAARFGEGINGQRRFEQALLGVEMGRPRFCDVSVHSQWVPDGNGGTKKVDVVSGRSFNGQYVTRNGKLLAEWRPSFFLADVPYKPKSDPAEFAPPQAAQRFHAIAEPRVTDFLDCVAAARGTGYTRAWWLGMGFRSWTATMFVLIGIVLPALINLWAFGSLLRPPEEKGISLRDVKAHADAPAPQVAPALDMARLTELEAQLEAELAAAAPAGVVDTPAPIREIAAAPLEAVAAGPPDEKTEFGVKKEDFYPTALRAPHQPQSKH